MFTLHKYDPQIQPNAEAWLATDEQVRISLVEKYHRRAKIELPNVRAHAAFHVIIENQIAMQYAAVVHAVPRLMSQGLSRHDAIHAISTILAEQLHDHANSDSNDPSEHFESHYAAEVEKLNANDWLSMRDE